MGKTFRVQESSELVREVQLRLVSVEALAAAFDGHKRVAVACATE